MKAIKIYSIDELNNMQLEDLDIIEFEVRNYYKKVQAVRRFTEELERED